MEAGIGLGNLVGGFAIGLIGARLREGPARDRRATPCTGACLVGLALTGNVAVAIGLAFGSRRRRT